MAGNTELHYSLQVGQEPRNNFAALEGRSHTEVCSHRASADWQLQMTNKPPLSEICKWFLSIHETTCGLTPNKERGFEKGEARRARVMQVEQSASKQFE